MEVPESAVPDIVAHTRNESGQYHRLSDHLLSVAELARQHAEPFGAGDLAWLAGRWHDLGKAHPDFQDYLFEAERGHRRRGPDHKAAGTCFAAQYPALQLLTFVITGHHGGLPDRDDKLRFFLQKHCGTDRVEEALTRAKDLMGSLDPPENILPPAFIKRPADAELFIRMLFSCLVDADVIDTKRHHAADVLMWPEQLPSVAELWRQLEKVQERLVQESATTEVNVIRNEIYQHCVNASTGSPGAFRLTVPTGGGKTRSGLAFALRHAVEHNLRRVIVAVPYTSITEQTADTYRSIFSSDTAVLEHHSAIDPDEREDDAYRSWAEHAAENWDAPLIVTTTVQLLESLFAHRTTACRKLHNIAGSVIILDEVQSLPPGLMAPTLDVLRQLIEHYRVTVVFSTATQPALDERAGFPGIPGMREIVENPKEYFTALRRVEYQQPDEPLSWLDAADRMRQSEQVLAIVNTRADARSLFEALDDPDALHLSTLMYGTHRRKVLQDIRQRIANGEPCRVVSTQLVEAGVDLDFPLVLRAIGPLDRIVQAAGRCNREGLLERGQVVIFEPAEGTMPPGEYRTGADLARMMFDREDNDLHNPTTYQRFFEALYRDVSLDSRKIQSLRQSLAFPEVARKYRIVDQQTSPVVISHYGEEDLEDPELVDRLLQALDQRKEDPRRIWRALQARSVNLTHWQLDQAERKGAVIQVRGGLWRTTPQAKYHGKLGLLLDEADAGALVF